MSSRMTSKAERHQPVCNVSHYVINKLTAIIGNCDLMLEKMEKGTEHARRLAVIREIANETAKELTDHQFRVEAEMKKTEERKAG